MSNTGSEENSKTLSLANFCLPDSFVVGVTGYCHGARGRDRIALGVSLPFPDLI